ncbi:integrase family protein : : Phage_integrase [Gemmata massiliana]|uniref:Integrase family protein:: Phage_integrase n=1 Tax=Gemmata massiliana TaxID=1210884 RepID=A0A6P2D1P2_9BACT|nr:site-specific integrase [Gemmata massiliana]VTR93342.1 integrase family protein : : Phage_integrase [Gemmata massiliana]
MGQQAQHTHKLADGTLVWYSLTDRPGGYRVRFVGPNGKRVERATGCRTKGEAREAAPQIIEEEYRPALPPEPSKANWDTVLNELESTLDLRPDSVRAYRTAIGALRAALPELTGPADVTNALAHQFKRKFLSGTYARGKASDAKRYTRSPTSCTTYLRALRSLWHKHFRPLGYVTENPWHEVPYPNVPRGKRVRVPPEQAVTDCFKWLEQKHPGWGLPRLFVQVKMLAGGRTLDLCKVRTADLGADSLTLTAEATKTREARTVPLPADVLTELRKVAGPIWLWENSAEESRRYRPNPQTKNKKVGLYRPSTWRWTIQNLFREFNAGRPEKSRLRPHDLRARAITVVAAATQNVDATARAMGVDPQTARHYLDAAQAFDRSDILKRAADLLLPPTQTPPSEK